MNDSFCLSDHNAVRCLVEPIVKSFIFHEVQMKSTSLKHKFPWRNQMFCELYFDEINAAFDPNEKYLKNLFHLDQKAYVEDIFDKIPKMMFRSARLAVKK